MGCIGCPIGSFHTVEEACKEHHVDLGGFLAALSDAAAGNPSPHFEEDSAIKMNAVRVAEKNALAAAFN